MNLLDVEESLLDRLEDKSSTVERELVARERPGRLPAPQGGARSSIRPNTPEGCEECLRDGTHWVHLRLCLTCGHVGCCDSSPERHAAGTSTRAGTR